MHVLKLSAPVSLPDGSVFDAGEWLVQDDNAFQLAALAERGSVMLDSWPGQPQSPADIMMPEHPKSILLIRSGAIGDLLLLSPAISALQAKYPASNISIACHKRHWPILSAVEIQMAEYPIPMDAVGDYDLIIPLEHIVELSTEKGIHATDAFAEAIGVAVTDYKPVYKAFANEIPESLIARGPRRIALQLRASAIIRDYPLEQWMKVIGLLVSKGWEVLLIGTGNPIIKNATPTVRDCGHLTFREAAAVLATCDVFCGVDSSFFNLCAALGMPPAVGLFGPVDWRTRVKEGSGQVALHGEAPCAPCGWTNTRAGKRFPPHGPCAKTGFCVPLAEIAPARIVAVCEREAKK